MGSLIASAASATSAPHTVVLTRDDGATYRIVQTESNPNTIVWAPMSSFGQKSVWMKIG